MAKDAEIKSGRKAELVRGLLKSLLREKVKTKAAKQHLAAAIGVSASAIDQMIYYGEGGLDVWVAALMHTYDVNEESLAGYFAEHQQNLRKLNPMSAADKAWFALRECFSENELLVEASLIRARFDIEVDLGLRKKVQRRRSSKG